MSEEDSNTRRLTINTNKFGVTFHRTFWLSRPQVSQILNLARDTVVDKNDNDCLSKKLIREGTHLGTIQVKAMSRFAQVSGLLDSHLCLTVFGKMAQERDPLLDYASTQWLIHYYLSTPVGIGPYFWNELVRNRFRIGNELLREEVEEYIVQAVADSEDREIKERDTRSTANVFLRTYLERDALGNLALLEELDEGHYLVLDPEPPSAWVYGVALLDYWQAQFGNRISVNLQDLLEPGGLGDLFLIGAGRLNRYLRQLQEVGYVEVHRTAPPFQVILLQRDPGPLLEKMYAF